MAKGCYAKVLTIGENDKPQTLIASVAQASNPKYGYLVYYAPKKSDTVKDVDYQPFNVDDKQVKISASSPQFVSTLPGTYAFALDQQQDVDLNLLVVDYLVTVRGTI
ncbi:hypothetical protein [Xenorhabdus innexi]|uniref:Uncharacterized protein n=1 Tax=Xenorhabdus innexi TaxID=290109 RepID=A0A1N6MWP3_9GAMM|nr:hypothetical protein [Xenorhabdus innexi]PHM35933.1 hypothetical protein Xinn_02003 [Xenorhabdus innexi]SIP73232.1 hypothetical protein XIS1_1790038 [Xenorhabdus innexi]